MHVYGFSRFPLEGWRLNQTSTTTTHTHTHTHTQRLFCFDTLVLGELLIPIDMDRHESIAAFFSTFDVFCPIVVTLTTLSAVHTTGTIEVME